jgi:hypothetical protein
MTLISTQHNKLGGASGDFIKKQMTPTLFAAMEKRGFPMSPYVNTLKYDTPPENGIYGFMETPRYASGYAALYQSLAFVTETHMLKPFPIRVDATQAMLEEFISYTKQNADATQCDFSELIKPNVDLRNSQLSAGILGKVNAYSMPCVFIAVINSSMGAVSAPTSSIH